MTVKTDCGLNMGEVGASAALAFAAAIGSPESPGDPGRWARFAAAADTLLQKFEGTPWEEVAQEVYESFVELLPSYVAPKWEELPIANRLAWEAVARQLVWLFDMDEPLTREDLTLSETRWASWAALKVKESAQRSVA